jgi:hypothetical protein
VCARQGTALASVCVTLALCKTSRASTRTKGAPSRSVELCKSQPLTPATRAARRAASCRAAETPTAETARSPRRAGAARVNVCARRAAADALAAARPAPGPTYTTSWSSGAKQPFLPDRGPLSSASSSRLRLRLRRVSFLQRLNHLRPPEREPPVVFWDDTCVCGWIRRPSPTSARRIPIILWPCMLSKVL